MPKVKCILALILMLPLASSCIFQNDPVKPNNLPRISSYYPDSTYLYRMAPDSCFFSISALDPDGDQLEYHFTINDRLSSVFAESAVLHFDTVGFYHVQGQVYDGSGFTHHDWYVTVTEKENEPPEICWVSPQQSNVACAVGDTLEFRIGVEDENPQLIQYSYYLSGELIHTGSPIVKYRFLERGDYILEGVVSDGEYSDATEWFVRVVGFPDTIPPGPIVDLQGGPGENIGTVRLTWTAPGEDNDAGTVASYTLRTSVFPILTEEDWNGAAGKLGEPEPSEPGSQEVMIVENLNPGTYLYATMRATDDFFNLSPIGRCIKVLVRGVDLEGRVINSLINEPVQGIMIRAEGKVAISDGDGRYTLENMPMYTRSIRARDEDAVGFVGDYYNNVVFITGLFGHTEMDFFMMPFIQLQDEISPYDYYGNFFIFFKDITDTNGEWGKSTVLARWNHFPVSVYNPPRMYGEIDLQGTARAAMEQWEEMTGIDLFVEVGDTTLADVRIIYDAQTVDRHEVRTPVYNDDHSPAKKEVWIYLQNSEIPLARYASLIFKHEFGHVLCVGHSANVGHIMAGGTTPQVKDVTSDEAAVVKIIYNSPYIFDYATIIEE